MNKKDIPLHTSTLTFVLLAWDRFRFVRNPTRARFPALVCSIGAWLTSGCLVLPYPIYIIYIDLGQYFRMSMFQGVGLCTVNLADDMKEYMRWIFFLMYVSPLSLISYLFIRISRELQNITAIVTFQSHFKDRSNRPRTDSHSTNADFRNSRSKLDRCSQYSRSECSDCDPLPSRRDDAVGGGLDRARERRAQRFLVTALTAYGLCLCPLMILRLARLALIETYDNSGHFDVTYALFVWLAFAPTCVTPVAFAAWQTSGSRMDRLRGYFRFSNHKFRHSCETVMTTTMGTPPAPSHRPPSRRCPQLPDDTASDTNSSHHETVSSHHETIDLRHETKYFINETSDFIHETSDLRNETNDMRRSPNNGARHETGGLRYETVGVRHETGRCHRETSLT